MTQEREHAHAYAAPGAATRDDDLVPGRSNRAAQLIAPANPLISGLIQRKARDENGVAEGADEVVASASSSSGHSLPDTVMRKFESSLGADLSSVRVHTSSASAHAAESVGAKAYTLGQDIHFATGQYDPASRAGQHLLAHEVAHTVQQRGNSPTRQNKLQVSTPQDAAEHEADSAADAMLDGRSAMVSTVGVVQRVARETNGEIIEWMPAQEDVAWDNQYDEKYKATRPKGDSAQQDFDNERNAGKVQSASSTGGTKVKTQVSPEQMKRIIMAGGEKAAAERIAPMAGGISQAFETMLIDTAQAQADYLAHMAGETGGVLEEKQGEKRSYAPFQGRGPVQVTNPENYAKALGILQQRADQIQKQIEAKAKLIANLMTARDQATDGEDKQKVISKIDALHAEVEPLRQQLLLLQDAINAIKADPANAKDERYAFLLSAAHMQRTGAVAASANLGATASFTGKGSEDSWVTGGNKGMTFGQRETQNQTELADINKKLETESDPDKLKQLKVDAASRERLIKDMESAKSRGSKKAAVYAAGVRILKAENAVAAPATAP